MRIARHLTVLIAASVFCASSAFAADQGAPIDLTPTFAGMEKDCAIKNSKFEAALGWLHTQSKKPPSVKKASAELQAAVGTGQIAVANGGDFWDITVPTPNATYRGVRLAAINRFVGKDNGISGISLIFADSKPVVAKALGKIGAGVKADPEAMMEPTVPQLLAQEKTARPMLMCDFSN